MLVGAVLAAGLWGRRDRLPRIPAGDIVVAEEAAFRASRVSAPRSSGPTGTCVSGRRRASRCSRDRARPDRCGMGEPIEARRTGANRRRAPK